MGKPEKTCMGAFNRPDQNRFREALEAACQRAQKAEEFRAQHGPVKVLMRNGVRCDGSDN